MAHTSILSTDSPTYLTRPRLRISGSRTEGRMRDQQSEAPNLHAS
jgi:hypothetical protein